MSKNDWNAFEFEFASKLNLGSDAEIRRNLASLPRPIRMAIYKYIRVANKNKDAKMKNKQVTKRSGSNATGNNVKPKKVR